MYSELGRVTLGDGQAAVIARVDGPDVDWAPRLIPFLAHKGWPWTWQIEQTISADIHRLEAHHYLALRGEELLSSVVTYEHAGAGVFGHVFTHPTHRRKGACKAIMGYQMNDFRLRGGRALYLGTGYDSVAYHIYVSFGFRSVFPRSGYMHYYSQSESAFERDYYAPGDATIRDVEWTDWAGLTTLTSSSTGPHLRLYHSEIAGRKSFEKGFLIFYHDLRADPRSRAKVTEVKETGAVVGLGHLVPDARFGKDVYLLDLYVHPRHADKATSLLEALDLPSERKIQSFVGADDVPRRNALEAAGFKEEAVFKRQLQTPFGFLDVAVMSRG